MEAKFKELQVVEVAGAATGYGDLIGWIKSVELSNLSGQPYYHVQVDSQYTSTVYVAEKFIKETEKQLKCQHQYMNAGTLQGEAMKRCLRCGDYVKAV